MSCKAASTITDGSVTQKHHYYRLPQKCLSSDAKELETSAQAANAHEVCPVLEVEKACG
jgi:hypothetical protein